MRSIIYLQQLLLSTNFFVCLTFRNYKSVSLRRDLKLGIFLNPLLSGPNSEDLVWEKLRKDAEIEVSREPLLASYMHATILSHQSLESSLSFHMANQLSSSAMVSTQIQSIFNDAFSKNPSFRESIRLDILAVMDRDPAVRTSPDVLLYFKGFQALQTHRVAHWLWESSRSTLALFLQSRANAVFQIDIHPGAKFGDGVFIDHGTGVVVGETAVVGHNVSMLHKVTLGGSGKLNVNRHPQIGNGVLLGAGATLLGNIKVGDGSHIGACSMVLDDIPAYSVAVGVPARIVAKRQVLSESQAGLSMLSNCLTLENDENHTYDFTI
jgi:serine O-acetyltransferase